MALLVLCPTRGRPAAAGEVWESFVQTRTNETTALRFVVDDDDGTYDEFQYPADIVPTQGSMVGALNWAALAYVDKYDVIGFIGDDHRFRTAGWDDLVIELMKRHGPGFIYGNDLAQGVNLPTQVFISSKIIAALGWMALPTCKHLYVDNVWKDLGEAADSIFFVPSMIIEHLHPAYGKAEWDDGHRRVNSAEMYSHDLAQYQKWRNTRFETDVETVRLAIHG